MRSKIVLGVGQCWFLGPEMVYTERPDISIDRGYLSNPILRPGTEPPLPCIEPNLHVGPRRHDVLNLVHAEEWCFNNRCPVTNGRTFRYSLISPAQSYWSIPLLYLSLFRMYTADEMRPPILSSRGR